MTNLLYVEVPDPIVLLLVFALNAILSPTLARVTVVVPTMKSFQVEPSVVYSSETEGAEPTFYIATVEFACSALNVSPGNPGSYSHTLQMLGISSYALITSEDRS